MNFFDDTEVLLWADKPWVTYKGKNKQRNTYNISDVTHIQVPIYIVAPRTRSCDLYVTLCWLYPWCIECSRLGVRDTFCRQPAASATGMRRFSCVGISARVRVLISSL